MFRRCNVLDNVTSSLWFHFRPHKHLHVTYADVLAPLFSKKSDLATARTVFDLSLAAPSALEPAGLVNDAAVRSCLEIKRPRSEAVPSLFSIPHTKHRGSKTTVQALTFMREFWTFVVRISVTTTKHAIFRGHPTSFETKAGSTLWLPSVYLPFHYSLISRFSDGAKS